MAILVPVPAQEEQAFCTLLAGLNLDRADFELRLKEFPKPTFGSQVKTIEVIWENTLSASYGAAEETSWVDQFRAHWDDGTISEVLADQGKPDPRKKITQ